MDRDRGEKGKIPLSEKEKKKYGGEEQPLLAENKRGEAIGR